MKRSTRSCVISSNYIYGIFLGVQSSKFGVDLVSNEVTYFLWLEEKRKYIFGRHDVRGVTAFFEITGRGNILASIGMTAELQVQYVVLDERKLIFK